ncbi:hypothetical protein FHX69_4162 [Prauserella muralis]|nr:hypothetical protein FHX69_4162 [Prauserella muralis]
MDAEIPVQARQTATNAHDPDRRGAGHRGVAGGHRVPRTRQTQTAPRTGRPVVLRPRDEQQSTPTTTPTAAPQPTPPPQPPRHRTARSSSRLGRGEQGRIHRHPRDHRRGPRAALDAAQRHAPRGAADDRAATASTPERHGATAPADAGANPTQLPGDTGASCPEAAVGTRRRAAGRGDRRAAAAGADTGTAARHIAPAGRAEGTTPAACAPRGTRPGPGRATEPAGTRAGQLSAARQRATAHRGVPAVAAGGRRA